MRRYFITLSLILIIVLAVPFVGQGQGHYTKNSIQTNIYILPTAQDQKGKAYRNIQFDQEPLETLEEILLSINKQMKRLEERIGQALSEPDLDPAQEKALLLARSLVQKMIKLLESLNGLLRSETGPDSKKISLITL
ncbi:MAG: hypothetical protein JRG97_04075 [Deltaproteobacteria bacterium]|nr:hypothetical protein [Deltaproteobacteria bacterium]MBW2051661.1 hypothetical protein [Deltaproteobacteria bacterium]MBW2140234.1 hypothetical protein [Deltaproteobacteria bacterium]MBW2323432.1 hypothetical protein [Deltaproteobacteria bacterium]